MSCAVCGGCLALCVRKCPPLPCAVPLHKPPSSLNAGSHTLRTRFQVWRKGVGAGLPADHPLPYLTPKGVALSFFLSFFLPSFLPFFLSFSLACVVQRERLDELLLSPLPAEGCGGRFTCGPFRSLTYARGRSSFFLSFFLRSRLRCSWWPSETVRSQVQPRSLPFSPPQPPASTIPHHPCVYHLERRIWVLI